MSGCISGIDHIQIDGCSIFYITDFSEELKETIRSHLSTVCHGAAKAATGKPMYCYRTTLKEFVRRYNGKPEKTRKGMIGELLMHILLTEYLSEYQINSPFFNLEERSIKKGFDIVLNKKGEVDIWLAEVKSGECTAGKSSSATAATLINTAKNDLSGRLNEESLSLWMNAIHGAQIAIADTRTEKEAIVSVLENYGDEASRGHISSTDINAILVGTVFSGLSDRVDTGRIEAKKNDISKEKLFRSVFIVAIQKETYKAVYTFLESESRL